MYTSLFVQTYNDAYLIINESNLKVLHISHQQPLCGSVYICGEAHCGWCQHESIVCTDVHPVCDCACKKTYMHIKVST